MKRFFAILPIAFSICLPATVTAKELTKADLPSSFQHLMKGSVEQAIRTLAHQMLEIHPQGIVNQETIEQSVQVEMAMRRSSRMQRFLRIDLNFDGQITTEEMDIIAQYGRSNNHDRIELELMRFEADSNGDNSISYDELRGAVARSVQDDEASVRQRKFNTDFFVLDLDENGEVTIGEMAHAIRSIMAR